MDIRNYDDLTKNIETETLPEPININPFAPRHPYRLLIIGASGQGKTNVLLNLLTEYVYYDRLYLYAKTADSEDKYLWLAEYLKQAEDLAQEKAIESSIGNQTVLDTENPSQSFKIVQAWDTTLDNLVPVDDLDEQKQNLIVFDDMTLEGRQAHNRISEHFIRGRKKNCSYIYIGHSFFLLPKIIRINISDIIIFPPDNKKEIQELAKTYATRIEFKEFQRLLNETRDPNVKDGHEFIYIDTRAKDLRMWIRNGFDNLYVKSF
jgi:Poxvirus A32 protein